MLALLIAGLAVLATLQYRWIDRVSDAERQQIHRNLEFAGRRFTEDFAVELQQAFDAFVRDEEEDVFTRYDEWKRRAPHPRLIAGIYTMTEGEVQRVDLETGELTPAELPLRRPPGQRRGPPPGEMRGPFHPDELALLVLRGPPPQPDPLALRNATLLMLDRTELMQVILPELTKRHFAMTDVALIGGETFRYQSNPAWPDGSTPPDLELPFAPMPGRGEPRRPPSVFDEDPPPPRAPMRLLVRRQNGGVDATIADARRRNLALSFGILLILAATIAVLLALLRRAERMRLQQTEFVAAMSHELNTPVAALRSAGENLRDGIVVEQERVVRYGNTIVREASRLGEMLGQVLEYAGMQARRTEPARESVDVAGVIEQAVAQCRFLVDGTAIEVAVNVEPSLPPVSGDPKALTAAVQNLLANAIRYGGSGGWVGVRAARERNGDVCITVEDRGPGIDSHDASHVFEPFYRGRNQSSTRGAGLGLSIVQRVVQAHGGRVALARRDAGAAFTIQLPAVRHA